MSNLEKYNAKWIFAMQKDMNQEDYNFVGKFITSIKENSDFLKPRVGLNTLLMSRDCSFSDKFIITLALKTGDMCHDIIVFQ